MTAERRGLGVWVCAGLAMVAGVSGVARAQPVTAADVVTSGLNLPLWMGNAPGDSSRLFIVEQRSGNQGRIRVFSGGTLASTPFLSVTVSTGGEQGLLGLAFHPQYQSNGFFWVNYTNPSGTTIVARGQRSSTNPNQSTGTLTTILSITQDFNNHNGGWIGFGPDGYLYIASGDGGNGNDPNNRAQDLNSLLGKMLRIDVDGADNIPGNDDDDGVLGSSAGLQYTSPPNNPYVGVAGRDEIWAWGLRNPWRNSFDRVTGDLWIADVGQDIREEVNFQPAGDPFAAVGGPGYQGGRNYGWRCREGTQVTPAVPALCGAGLPNPRTEPLFEYGHSVDIAPTFRRGCSITGGFVYRGCSMPWLVGQYIFADYCDGMVIAYNPATGVATNLFDLNCCILSFGEDALGEIYIAQDRATDRVVRIVPVTLTDCNSNGVADGCDIASGTAQDRNSDGVPDCCGPCWADADGSGGIPDISDIIAFFDAFNAGLPSADVNGTGGVPDIDDVLLFFDGFVNGCC